jgi:hypothetical protein
MTEVTIMEPKVVPLRAGGRVTAIIPQNVEEVFRLATAIAKSGLAPSTMRTPEALTVAILHGAEIGLPPMLAVQKIAVVNGRPALWGDAVPALLLSKGFRIDETVSGDDDERAATCTVTRPDGVKITRKFSVSDAKLAGLWGKAGPWKQYPDRMLMMRARGYAARDGAADVLAGLYIAEEIQDIDTTPTSKRKSSAESKRDGTTERFNQIRAEIARATTADDIDRIEATHEAEIATMAVRWAEIINDELAARRDDLSVLADADAVLREIERALSTKPADDVHAEYASAIMAMDEDSRSVALEMIEAAKGAP